MRPLIAIPIKPFGIAKARLRPVLDAIQRSLMGKAIAGHTIAVAQKTGAQVAVVTADDGVAEFAEGLGATVIREEPGVGINGAAALVTDRAGEAGVPWLMLHADLPLLTPLDLEAALDRFRPGGYVIAPSYDGGTALLMGEEAFAFSYGPASYHRHLAAAGENAEVVVRTGLALDLDTPQDLEAMEQLGVTGTWHSIPG